MTADQSVGRALWRRLTFQQRHTTGLLVALIVGWYLVQLAVASDWPLHRIRWAFTTHSFPALSPGLVLAAISHASVRHVASNALGLWLAAGESEQVMHRLGLVAFFGVTALGSVLVGTAVGGSTMGASGAVFGFVGFYCTVRTDRWSKPVFQTADSAPADPATPPQALAFVWVVAPPVLALWFLGQALGVLPVDRADPVGHLTGLCCGVGYAVVRRRDSY